MSIAVMTAVWNLDLDSTEKLIMLAFADHANDEGVCYPSSELIAHKSGVSVRHAKRVVKSLIERGLLQVQDEGGGRGNRRVVLVDPGKGDTLPPFKREKKGDTTSPNTLERVTSDAETVTPTSPEPLVEPSEERHASNEAGKPDVENSHARYGELARKLGGNRSNAGRWINWALARDDPDQAERIMRGTLSLKERGAIEYFVKPRDPCAPGTLSSPIEGQPIERYAESEYYRITRPRRRGPKNASSDPSRLSTQGAA